MRWSAPGTATSTWFFYPFYHVPPEAPPVCGNVSTSRAVWNRNRLPVRCQQLHFHCSLEYHFDHPSPGQTKNIKLSSWASTKPRQSAASTCPLPRSKGFVLTWSHVLPTVEIKTFVYPFVCLPSLMPVDLGWLYKSITFRDETEHSRGPIPKFIGAPAQHQQLSGGKPPFHRTKTIAAEMESFCSSQNMQIRNFRRKWDMLLLLLLVHSAA